MKMQIPNHARLLGATFLGMVLLADTTAPAALVPQTVNQSGTAATGWAAAIWNTPAVVATAGNDYVTTNTFAVRTPNTATPVAFAGNSLMIDPGGILYLKHNGGAAKVNLRLNGGTITYHGGVSSASSPLSGTIQMLADSQINSDQASPNNRDIWFQSDISGSANIIVAMNTATNYLIVSGTNAAYSGNWTNIGGIIQIASGTTNALGSGSVSLVNGNTSLAFNSTNDLVIGNRIDGPGYVTKQNTGAVVLTANNTFTGGLTNQAGTLVLTGSGTQISTVVNSSGVLRIANSAALPAGSPLLITPNNAQTGRLELSNSVTLATGLQITVQQRTGPTVAVQSLSGNNVISDQVGILGGGTSPIGVQVDAGSTLVLNGGITSITTGERGVMLQGAGNGAVAGVIDNGSATTVSLFKNGPGTWTLNNANTYSGLTQITNGVLKLGASGSLASSSGIYIQSGGTLDASLVSGGLAVGGAQVLAGSGAVLGDVTTTAGTLVQVGLTNQYGQFSFTNNLTLGGGETIQFEFNASTNDLLNVAGSLTLNGSSTIQIILPTGVAGIGTFRLINYSGTLQGGGSFTLVSPVSSQTFALDTSIPGQVNLIVTGVPQNRVWSGDGVANVWDVATTPNWSGQTFNQADNVTFDDAGSATPEINVSVPMQTGTFIVSNTVNAYTFSGSGITAVGSLIKRGANLVALANDGNNFSGPISIEAGTLSIGNGGSTGSLGTGAITNNGQLLINKSALPANTINGQITGSGSLRLTGGGASLSLAASNSYAGPTTIEGGCQLNLFNNSALGDTNVGTIVQAGGRVGFITLGTWTVAEPLEINGYGVAGTVGALYANTANNNITWKGPITVGSPSQIRIVNTGIKMTLANSVTANQQTLQCTTVDTGSVLTFSNTLSLGNDPALAALTKDGVGTMILAGSSNLCGSVVVNAGTLQVTTTNAPLTGDITVNAGTLQLGTGAGDGSMPVGAINLVGSGTKLTINSSNTFVLNNQLTGLGSVSLLNFATLIINSSNTFAGNLTTGSGTPTYGGIISLFNSYGLGDGTVAKNVKLVHAALYLQGGLDIPAAISFSTSSGANDVVDTAVGVAKPIRNVSGTNIIQGNITPTSGDGNSEFTVESGLLTLNGTIAPDTTTRVVILSGAANGVLNGSLNDNGVNIPALTKQGAGKWTLNNVNNYSGATVVQNGTLMLGASAAIANTPSIQISTNAVLDVTAVSGGFVLGGSQTLKGVGTVLGDFNATGIVAPGPLGTLNFSNHLTLAGTTVMELNRAAGQKADLISAVTLAFGGTLTITNLGTNLQVGDTFNLFDGAISGSFAATNLPALSSTNLFWDVSLLNSQGIVTVGGTVAAVPTIAPPSISGTNLILQVSSQSGFNYILEATSQLAPTAWVGIQTNAGGGVLTFTVPVTAVSPQQFFRILVQ
jgi:autotransporter-associated beta strand protein